MNKKQTRGTIRYIKLNKLMTAEQTKQPTNFIKKEATSINRTKQKQINAIVPSIGEKLHCIYLIGMISIWFMTKVIFGRQGLWK